jgi:hypothetical protein
MGTNYYVATGPDRCQSCGRGHDGENLHIGKSSIGWQFLFAPYPDRGLTSWRAWKAHLAASAYPIVDEYGQTVGIDDFARMVDERQRTGTLHYSAREIALGYDKSCETRDADGYRFSTSADFS